MIRTHIHFPQGTTTVEPDGEYNGYEYTRRDIPTLLDIHIYIEEPHRIHIHIAHDGYITISHKYITLHSTEVAVLGTRKVYIDTYRGSEKNKLKELQELMMELTCQYTAFGERLCPLATSTLMANV